MTTFPPLTERIAAILTVPASSSDLSAIIAETATAIARLNAEVDTNERVSLDPLASFDAVEAAADEVVRLSLVVRRHQSALQHLDERLKQVSAAEREEQARATREAAVVKRDAAAKALRDRYPKLAGDIAALMQAVIDADTDARAAGIPGVEEVARGVRGNGTLEDGTNRVTSLVRTIRLPHLIGHDQVVKGAVWDGSRVRAAW